MLPVGLLQQASKPRSHRLNIFQESHALGMGFLI